MAEPFSFGIAKGDSQRTKAESGDADEQGLAGSRSGPPVDQRRRTAARGEDARPGLRFRPHRSAKARVARRNSAARRVSRGRRNNGRCRPAPAFGSALVAQFRSG